MSIIKTFDGREGHIIQKSSCGSTPLSCNNDSLAGAVSQRAAYTPGPEWCSIPSLTLCIWCMGP